MSRVQGLLARLRDVFRRRTAEDRMEEEFAFHIEMETRRLIAQGTRAQDARRQARMAFGAVEAHRESMRDERGARWFADLGADVRYALGSMRRSPGFALAVALTLGIGIGVNGAIFGYVNSLLLRPIPARDAHELVGLFDRETRSGDVRNVPYVDYVRYRDQSKAFTALAGGVPLPLNLTIGSGAGDMVWGEMVTEDFFPLLDMRASTGRFFTPADAPQGANAFVVLSHDSWQKRFAGDPAIAGKTIRLNGHPFTITGVAPPGFRGLRLMGFWPEMWVPVGMHNVALPGSTGMLEARGGPSLMLIGRMKPGFNRDRTQAAAEGFARQLATLDPAARETMAALVVPASTGLENPMYVKPAVLTLSSALGMFAAIVTLLVICANLANLQLARTLRRAREFGIRLSLGCPRSRLTRQLIVEAAVLALPGLLIAMILTDLGTAVEPYLTPKLQFQVGFSPTVDVRVTLYTAAVALFATVMFGLLPALRASRMNLVSSVAHVVGSGRPSKQGRPSRLRGALVVSQLALSVVLLVAGVLFARSLFAAGTTDVGFDPRDRVLLSMNVGLQGYNAERGQRFYDDLLVRVRALPFVQHAALAFPAPFDTYERRVRFFVEGLTSARDGTIATEASYVSDGFADALGIRLEAGRDLTPSDGAGSLPVMVVSRTLATRLWPGQDPIGRTVRLSNAQGPEVTVVGVVRDARFLLIGVVSPARAYFPLKQRYRDWETLIVHTRGDAAGAVPALRDTIASIDPALPLFGVTTMNDAVSSGLTTSRSAAVMAGFFGALALLVAAVGLYAVVAGSVSERTKEMGLRMALGASPRGVVTHLMRSGARMGIIGLALGMAGAFAVARVMAGLLYGVSPSDPMTFIGVPLVLAGVVGIATWLPARRAARLSPVRALRID
jgi:predicted permease